MPRAEEIRLDNGVELYVINIGDQPVVRLECIFEGGVWQETTAGASYFAIKMLQEGTSGRSSAQVSEAFDSVGAFVEMNHSSDRTGIMVYCLSRFLPAVLPVISEMISDAAFPEKEWKDLQNITLQNLRVNLRKDSWVASGEFRKLLFGISHPYAFVQTEEQVSGFDPADAVRYYERHIRQSRFRIILSGQVSDESVGLVNRYLGQVRGLVPARQVHSREKPEVPAGQYRHIERADSVQSSLRTGKELFTRHHPDYFRMLVTNEVLGGYFGSRLMKNIREEKGLTYGISSHVVSLRDAGYFMVGADVGKESAGRALEEISREIRKLQTGLMPGSELETVKNYMTGEFAGSLNTAFEVADRRKILILEDLPVDFFENYIAQIHRITVEDIQETAAAYLRPEDMVTVVAG